LRESLSPVRRSLSPLPRWVCQPWKEPVILRL